jgi:hypothetical protein
MVFISQNFAHDAHRQYEREGWKMKLQDAIARIEIDQVQYSTVDKTTGNNVEIAVVHQSG